MSMFDRFKAAWADFDSRVAHFIGTAYLGEGEPKIASKLTVDTSEVAAAIERLKKARAENVMVDPAGYGFKVSPQSGTYFNVGAHV